MPAWVDAWAGAGASVGVALLAALGERRRRLRMLPDQVGMIDWVTVQAAAIVAAILCVSVALHK